MRENKGKAKKSEESQEKTVPEGGLEKSMPIVASVRTGLAGKEDAVMRRIPADYGEKTVSEVIEYIIGNNLKDSELSIAESVKKELRAKERVVVINGKTANLNDKADQYLIVKKHELPDGTVREYREFETEISAVQQGGLYRMLM